jgi:hypothetical protein
MRAWCWPGHASQGGFVSNPLGWERLTELRGRRLMLCGTGAGLESTLDKLQQARVLFAVHGHHFQQQTVQATAQPFLTLRQTTQRLGAGLLLVDQGAGECGQILTGRGNRCGHAGQCVGRIRPVQRVA